MDWLEGNWTLVKCKDKTIIFLTHEGVRQEIQGIKRSIDVHPIISNQLRECIQKGFQIYIVEVGYTNSKDKIANLEKILVIQDFFNVFPKEIMGFHRKTDI